MARGQTEREIAQFVNQLEKTVTALNKRDRNKLLGRGAAIVRRAVRTNTKRRPRSARPGSRTSGGRTITYKPGNLRASQKVLRRKLRRSPDLFVGPEFGGSAGVTEYGPGTGKTDGYYYGMAYGGKQQYLSRVVDPALAVSGPKAIEAIERKFVELFGTRAAQQGLKVN